MPPNPRENRPREKRLKDSGLADKRARDGEAEAVRTPIWVAGSQQPKFNLRAWGFVGQALTRRWLGPRLDWTAGSLSGLGGRITAGHYRLKTGWMGKANCIVPSHQAVGSVVTGAGNRVADARGILLPRPTPPEPVAHPNLIRPDAVLRIVPAVEELAVWTGAPAAVRQPAPKLETVRPAGTNPDSPKPEAVKLSAVPQAAAQLATNLASTVQPSPCQSPSAVPQATTSPAPAPHQATPTRLAKLATVEPTLSAIRAMIHADQTPAPAYPRPDHQPGHVANLGPNLVPVGSPDQLTDTAAAAQTPARLTWLRPHVARTAAHVIAWSVLAITLPIGLVQATLYHLNGGDLADWD